MLQIPGAPLSGRGQKEAQRTDGTMGTGRWDGPKLDPGKHTSKGTPHRRVLTSEVSADSEFEEPCTNGQSLVANGPTVLCSMLYYFACNI